MAKKPAELPESVRDYIVNDLDRKLTEVIAHRNVKGEEPLYAVLMKNNDGSMFTVIFLGSYKARRPLGDYEEATPGNAELVRWNCTSDAEPWEHSIERFKNAPYDMLAMF
jgi:hypothetical protein